jgi:DNA-binding XRE family transcriptional regulator
MNRTSSDPKAPPNEFGDLLRYWRDVRGVSQLDLSLEAGVSQRQISFIESERSVPGRRRDRSTPSATVCNTFKGTLSSLRMPGRVLSRRGPQPSGHAPSGE